MKLSEKKCIPCEDNTVQPLSYPEAKKYFDENQEALMGWVINDVGTRISLERLFPDFRTAMIWVNQVAELAEAEGHHPDIQISYNRVILDLWTHSIGGLSENDFILASKVSALF